MDCSSEGTKGLAAINGRLLTIRDFVAGSTTQKAANLTATAKNVTSDKGLYVRLQ